MFAYKARRFQEMGMEKVTGREKLKDTEKYGSGNNMEGVEL